MPLLSRRLFGNALLAAPLLGASPAAVTIAAAATPAAPSPVIRRRVGRFEVTFLLDGYIDFPYAVFTGIAPDALEGAARGLHIARPTGVRSGFTQWLIRDGRHTVLVDAGPAGTVSPTSGRLPQALAAAGVQPAQVEAVIATHLHVDHIAGLVAGGRRVFPNAEVFADRRDVAHFTDPAKAAAAPDLLKSSFQAASELVRLYPRLQRVDGARSIIPGVTTFDLAGHTPGQVGVRIEDGGQSLLLVSDMLFHPGLHPAHPGIGILFEQDRAAADASRARFFDQAAAEGAPLAATHMPFPGVGRIIRSGSARTWLPADFDYAA
ncbi:MBL fold metallo-hydrolase [Roseomonas sp. HF4]|uniref:MBL fold metallo-hydrolase n=1 Tax=Roseomonas sp. HF4 TaxID=2562313 RepID=UPI0010BFFC8C|nr:MBL fold metallo-hydrolase [Roseomonas sp. HF4]